MKNLCICNDAGHIDCPVCNSSTPMGERTHKPHGSMDELLQCIKISRILGDEDTALHLEFLYEQEIQFHLTNHWSVL